MGGLWSNLNPGDLIEYDGAAVDNQWGVYTGSGYAVHLTAKGEVRRDPLMDVAAGRVYKVNNKYDRYVTPYAPNQIVANALQQVGRRYTDCGAEKFAAIMRHGPSSEAPFLDPGDLVEFPGRWGVYVGHGNIVLFAENQVIKMPLPDGIAYKVNNKYDNHVQPFTPNQIVTKALEEVGKMYGNSQASSESFAAKMRYGISCEGPFPKPGDLIEYERSIYQHWGVYINAGYVVHLTGRGIEALSLSASQSVGNSSGLEGTAQIKKDHMEEVANGSRYKVNNKFDRRKTPFSSQRIVMDALRKVGESRWYHALQANCEHFATEMRYGESLCGQLDKAIVAGTAAAGFAGFVSGIFLNMA